MTQPQKGLVVIICGPAGSGKTTLCDRLCKMMHPQVQRAITTTSRLPRPEERKNIDYYFITKDEFQKKIDNHDFFEHALVHKNHHYGCTKEEIYSKLNAGIDVLLNIDVQGAETYRQAADQDPALKDSLVTLFILPPSLDELKKRLEERNPHDSDETARRLETAKEEIPHHINFDYSLKSTTKENDFQELLKIYQIEKKKRKVTAP